MCTMVCHMFGLLREPRVVIGIALLFIATITGGIFMQHATARIAVWQVDHPIAAGTVLERGDVHMAEVAGDVAAYAKVDQQVVGRTVSRPLDAGELLPAATLSSGAASFDEVMVPAEVLHMPDGLVRGERVDVWLTTSEPPRTLRVLASVRVVRTIAADVGGGRGVALAVAPAQSGVLVAALRRGELDLVRVSR